jgi:hypothetical protein
MDVLITANAFSVVSYRPHGPRGRKTKASYSFEVLYKFLDRSTEPGHENPAWQPCSAVAHTEALQQYCARDDVHAELAMSLRFLSFSSYGTHDLRVSGFYLACLPLGAL